MTAAETPDSAASATPQAAGAPPARATASPGGWVVPGYADVLAVLADERFEVAAVPPDGAAEGTIGWLRASVSRFTNGAEHDRRRALTVTELDRLDPVALHAGARDRATEALAAAGQPGVQADVMSLLARPVPMAVLAAGLGAADPDAAAAAAIDVAAAYFGAGDEDVQRAADQGVARLLELFGPAPAEVLVARITLLAQACDGTAGLIGETLRLLQDAPECGAAWRTDAALLETLRYRPAVRLIRRVARAAVPVADGEIAAGETVACDLDAANTDPGVFGDPDVFEPGRPGPASLTFGAGLRPCPAPAHALALAAGVVEAVRETCGFLPGQPVDYEPPAALRIPARLEVILR
jgi:cytochrome P450